MAPSYPRWPDRTAFDLDTYAAGATGMWERMLRRFAYLHRVGHADGLAPLDADGLVPTEHLPAGGGGGGAVDSVNGKTGAVVLDAADVGALTQADADARYVRTVNGLGPDGSGNVAVSGGGTTPGAWTTVTLASGFLSHADNFGYPPQYRKVGDRVELRGAIRRNSGTYTSTAVTVATLPTGHRPVAVSGTAAAGSGTTAVAFFAGSAGGADSARFEINSNGELKVAVSGTGVSWVALGGGSFSTL